MSARKFGSSSKSAPRQSVSDWSNLPASIRDLAETPVGTLNTQAQREYKVIVSINEVDLRSFISYNYQVLESKAMAVGGNMLVTEDELFRLFITALKARVDWVTFTPTQHRIDSVWTLTVPMSIVIAAIGIIEQGAGKRFVPEWNSSHDELLLSVAEREDISTRLASMEPIGLTFVYSLPREKEGVERVMLVLTAEEEGDTFFYSDIPPHVLEVIVASLAGLEPSIPYRLEDVPPQLRPTHRIGREWAIRFMREFVNRSIA